MFDSGKGIGNALAAFYPWYWGMWSNVALFERPEDTSEEKFVWFTTERDSISKRIRVRRGGIHPLGLVEQVFERLTKWQRKRNDRIANVYLDKSARSLLAVLNSETSLRWDDIMTKANLRCEDALRAVSIISNAELCEVGPSRIRLSDVWYEMVEGKREGKNKREADVQSRYFTYFTQEPDENIASGTW